MKVSFTQHESDSHPPYIEHLIDGPERIPQDIPLSNLTSAVLSYVNSQQELDLDLIGSAVRTAAFIALLRSAALLPGAELVQASNELIARHEPALGLEVLRASAQYLQERQGWESFPPVPGPELRERRLEPRRPSILVRVWAEMAERSGPAVRRLVPPAFVKLEVAVSRLIRAMTAQGRVSLRSALRGATRFDAVMHFLAVLELARRRQIVVVQQSLFDDIIVESAHDDGRADSRAG